jgi:hypothetical protein
MSDYGITLSNPSPVIGTAAHQLEELIFSGKARPTRKWKCLMPFCAKLASQAFYSRRILCARGRCPFRAASEVGALS